MNPGELGRGDFGSQAPRNQTDHAGSQKSQSLPFCGGLQEAFLWDVEKSPEGRSTG